MKRVWQKGAVLLLCFHGSGIIRTDPWVFAQETALAEETGGELLELVLGLIQESDRDLRALGFDQVRNEARGEAATRQFAAALPQLPNDGQVGLIRALADRADPAAKPAILERFEKSDDPAVREAAVAAIGYLGAASDVAWLVQQLTNELEAIRSAARASLVRLPGEEIPAAIVEQADSQKSTVRVELIEILASRRAISTHAALLQWAVDSDQAVRRAAMIALGQLASADQVAGMAQGILKATRGAEREAAEKALMTVCQRITPADQQAAPLLTVMQELSAADKLTLLPTLGRIGGDAARNVVEQAIAAPDTKKHDIGLRALCNWPDATVASRLIELAKSEPHKDHQRLALRALIRVAVVHDGRSDEDRLALLKTALAMSDRDEERQLVLQRARAVRSVESLRFLVTFLDQPSLASMARESIVELAHHRALRDAHKAEFHAALDQVLATSDDPVLKDRAQRYKNNQTWTRTSASSP